MENLPTLDIYIPPNTQTLDIDNYLGQWRIGLQGAAGSGKTFSAVGFENPIVISLDRGLISHIGRKDIIEVPFYLDSFIDSIVKRPSKTYIDIRTGQTKTRPANRKDALVYWLYKEAPQLKSNQTLILDGGSGIQTAFHTQYWTDPDLDANGKIKPWAEFRQKIDYFTEIMTQLKALTCNVIYISHEFQELDDDKAIRPLLSGQFAGELTSHFTDWFRCHTVTKPPNPEEETKLAARLGVSVAELKNTYIASTPACVSFFTIWETQPSSTCKCKTSLVGAPRYIPANYSTWKKYNRKNNEE